MSTAAITTLVGGLLFILAAQFFPRDMTRALSE
jgi:hypothetical protein